MKEKIIHMIKAYYEMKYRWLLLISFLYSFIIILMIFIVCMVKTSITFLDLLVLLKDKHLFTGIGSGFLVVFVISQITFMYDRIFRKIYARISRQIQSFSEIRNNCILKKNDYDSFGCKAVIFLISIIVHLALFVLILKNLLAGEIG